MPLRMPVRVQVPGAVAGHLLLHLEPVPSAAEQDADLPHHDVAQRRDHCDHPCFRTALSRGALRMCAWVHVRIAIRSSRWMCCVFDYAHQDFRLCWVAKREGFNLLNWVCYFFWLWLYMIISVIVL